LQLKTQTTIKPSEAHQPPCNSTPPFPCCAFSTKPSRKSFISIGCSPHAKVLVRVDDIEAFHRELHSRPNSNMRPGLETQEWGARTVTVIDPFSNQLVFNQPIGKA
jgi:uncharacterized glyoxalase superfamily protein PhnB